MLSSAPSNTANDDDELQGRNVKVTPRLPNVGTDITRASSGSFIVSFGDFTHPARISPVSAAGALLTLSNTPSEVETGYSAISSDVLLPTSKSPSQTTMSVADLRSRLEGLPQEIYDQVRDLTFAFDSNSESQCIGGKFHKVPLQLQIDQALRAKFLTLYYGSEEEWEFVPRSLDADYFEEVRSWLNTLLPDAFAAIHGPVAKPFSSNFYTTVSYSTIDQSWQGNVTWQDVCPVRS